MNKKKKKKKGWWAKKWKKIIKMNSTLRKEREKRTSHKALGEAKF